MADQTRTRENDTRYEKVKLNSYIAYIYNVLSASIEKMGIKVEAMALNENTLVMGIRYQTLADYITYEVDKTKWQIKIHEGYLYVKGSSSAQEEVQKVNDEVLSKIRKMGIEAGAYLTTDNDTIISIHLEGIIYYILQDVLTKARAKIGQHLRNIRVKFGTIDDFSYIVLYRKGTTMSESKEKSEIKSKLDEI